MQAVLFEVPRAETDWQRWSFHHRQSHSLIRNAIQQKGGPALTEYMLDPITFQDFQGFLERNGLTHLEMNSALGVQGAELDELDPRKNNELVAWIFIHAQEHRTAEAKLQI